MMEMVKIEKTRITLPNRLRLSLCFDEIVEKFEQTSAEKKGPDCSLPAVMLWAGGVRGHQQ